MLELTQLRSSVGVVSACGNAAWGKAPIDILNALAELLLALLGLSL